MNIYAKSGAKVVFANPESGYIPDQEQAKKYLVVGRLYTVNRTSVHKWSTSVRLVEVPNQAFNSVLFEDKNNEVD